MRVRITKLAAVATMAVGLALGVGQAGATPVTLPGWDGLDGADGAVNARRVRVETITDQDGKPRAGYMVGRYFVGILPE